MTTKPESSDASKGEPGERNLFQELIDQRDRQRERNRKSIWLIKGKDVPWESNAHGKMRWYLHPALEQLALRTVMFYQQEIPPGSRSGRQKCQGNVVFNVLEGTGYTVVNGTRHDWKIGDVINLPVREEGVIYQHFNTDPEKRALLIACEPNLTDALGVDKAAGFEELEAAPEYSQQRSGGEAKA